jgi:hypothetical protein
LVLVVTQTISTNSTNSLRIVSTTTNSFGTLAVDLVSLV